MANRTPVWITPERIKDLHRLAHDLLASLTTDADALLQGNEAEDEAWPDRDLSHLGARLDIESWVEHTTQQLRDVMYLLAVGDRGHTEVATADQEIVSKQAHFDRRKNALARLREGGLIEW